MDLDNSLPDLPANLERAKTNHKSDRKVYLSRMDYRLY